MEEIKKSRKRRKKNLTPGFQKIKFWLRLALYFFYFSAIFLALYYLFDKKDMLIEIEMDPAIFYWKIFGTSFLFALGLTAWTLRGSEVNK